MNRPIRNIAVGCLVMFLALLLNATYLQYWQAGNLTSLSAHPDNRRVLNEDFSKPRGAILVHGRAVAESNKSDDEFKFQRTYPEGQRYALLTGFFSRDSGVGGVEASQNSILSGSDPKLFVNRVIDLVGNQTPQGGSVSLTINPAAQKAAYDGLRALGGDVEGAVVAIQPTTGKILAMVSIPTYNPNALASHDFAKAAKTKARLLADKRDPLDNRAIETTVPPGSTFKLVTASAAIESGKFGPDSLVPGGSELKLPGVVKPLRNENLRSCGGSKITLTQALMVSCNVAFGSVGMKIGGDAMRKQAEKFGWGMSYFHDLDDDLTRQSLSRFPVQVNKPQEAQSAIGQYDVAATPLQMAMVGAGIANGGVVMRPYLVDEIRTSNLDVIHTTEPKSLSQATSSSTARKLTDMMVAVVDGGTARNAQIPGMRVAGKTGTAQTDPSRPPFAWFVSFAPAEKAQVAVAVLIQKSGVSRDEISGGGLAAPIAKAVMQAVMGQ